MRYAIGDCYSSSIEFMVIPTVVVTPGIGFDRFSVMLKFMFWGVGFYVFKR